MKKTSVNVAQLDLDIVNPRIKPEDNQTEAMRSLLAVEKDGEKVYELARDICEAGMLDPGDRLFVTPIAESVDRYVVLEGNRRLTALRLLSQPGMLDRDDIGMTSAMRNKFKRLQTEFKDSWPVEVDVVVFDSREAAKRFIRLRHTGENAGAGRSAWSSLQVARFDNTGLWQCLSYLRESRALDLAVINALDRSVFSITNFERVSGTLEFQERFGVSIGRTTFKITADQQRGTTALAKLASDVVSGRVDSRGEFAEARHMTSYLNELERYVDEACRTPESAPADVDPGGSDPTVVTPIRPSDRDARPPGAKAGGDSGFAGDRNLPPHTQSPAVPAVDPPPTTSAKPPRKPRTPKYLIDKKDLLTVTHLKCRAIVDELKQEVVVQDAPFACALLLRSLQELTAELYLQAFGIKTSDRSANIDAAANHLLGTPHNPTDPANRVELAKAFKLSRDTYATLSDVAHSKISSVSADHVRNEWGNMRGGMELLWRRIFSQEQAKKVAA